MSDTAVEKVQLRKRFPPWLRRPFPAGSVRTTQETLERFRLNTVCESALCPNRPECYSRGTATFMILGAVCTRSCGFCAISTGRPGPVDPEEPARVAMAAERLGLAHVVITSVARDELKDEGAGAFYETVQAIRKRLPEATIEVLTPDFHAKPHLVERVCDASPSVYNHNVETARRLTRGLRPQAGYDRSLQVLRHVKAYAPHMVTKSGLMLGLGERAEEVFKTLQDLRSAGCNIVTIGQYLQPKDGKPAVKEYVPPERFGLFEREARRIGFEEVYAGPYVRSSYHAGEVYGNSGFGHRDEGVSA